jgi:hypothetical protein
MSGSLSPIVMAACGAPVCVFTCRAETCRAETWMAETWMAEPGPDFTWVFDPAMTMAHP